MQIALLEQPGASSALDFLRRQLRDDAVTDLHIVVAWARTSGLNLFREELLAFRARGGRATLICGLSQASATVSGLRLALELFDEVRVAFDPSGVTFHTKLYVAVSPESTRIAIGSQNITRGGLTANHELGVSVVLPNSVPPHPFVGQVLDYIAGLEANADVVARLDEAHLQALIDGGVVRFAREGIDDPPARTPWLRRWFTRRH